MAFPRARGRLRLKTLAPAHFLQPKPTRLSRLPLPPSSSPTPSSSPPPQRLPAPWRCGSCPSTCSGDCPRPGVVEAGSRGYRGSTPPQPALSGRPSPVSLRRRRCLCALRRVQGTAPRRATEAEQQRSRPARLRTGARQPRACGWGAAFQPEGARPAGRLGRAGRSGVQSSVRARHGAARPGSQAALAAFWDLTSFDVVGRREVGLRHENLPSHLPGRGTV